MGMGIVWGAGMTLGRMGRDEMEMGLSRER